MKRFTSYERDIETDLDYAKARYFDSSFGRFFSPDPLLSSGKIEDGQSWNRYVYVRNNPLIYTDPLGLFIWSEALGGRTKTSDYRARQDQLKAERKQANKDKKNNKDELKRINDEIDKIGTIIDRRGAFIAGMNTARGAANNLTGTGRTMVNNALDNYGDENIDNGVVVALGDGGGNENAATGIENYDPKTGKASGNVIVAFNSSEFSSDTLFMTIAHEGSHIGDANNLLAGWGNTSVGGTEYSAYMVTVLASIGKGYGQTVNYNNSAIYQKGWKQIDHRALETALHSTGRGANDNYGQFSANWDLSHLDKDGKTVKGWQ